MESGREYAATMMSRLRRADRRVVNRPSLGFPFVVCAAWLGAAGCAHDGASSRTTVQSQTLDELVQTCQSATRSPTCTEQLVALKALINRDITNEGIFGLAADVRRGGSGGLSATVLPAVRSLLADLVVASHFDAVDELTRQLHQYDQRDDALRSSDAAQTLFAELTVRRVSALEHAAAEFRYHLADLAARLEGSYARPLPRLPAGPPANNAPP
jgi:hypothetical protein